MKVLKIRKQNYYAQVNHVSTILKYFYLKKFLIATRYTMLVINYESCINIPIQVNETYTLCLKLFIFR